ncbi:Bacteriophage tail assembly protein [Afipia felis]|uniref:Bacteriophage tail assembly protein n=1 Tax=Afipia felis TaxID=1035 RepID=A0A090MQK4_AFIFE|nr:Bacteriophage tail assembly protein [Afipia felis]
MHLPHGVDGEWIKQLVAEQLITMKTKRGFQRLEWQKIRERNEALDCRVYARAAAWIAGADRWTEMMWRDLEQQVGAPPEIEDDQRANIDVAADGIAGRVRRAPKRRDRRVFRSSYLG